MTYLARRADRWWSLVLMSLSLPAGLAPFIDGDAFNTPIFLVVKNIAPIAVWGLAWLVVSTVAAHSALTGRWWSYVGSNAGVLGLSTAWLGAVSWARFVDGQTLTLTAIGLWLFPMAACVHAILTPTQVVAATGKVAAANVGGD